MTAERPFFPGFVTAYGKRGGYCWDERPRCVNYEIGPHLVKSDTMPLDDAIVQCRHRPEKGYPRCGAYLYVAQLSIGPSAVIRGQGERVWLVVETSRGQAERMQSVPMLFLERMVLLGLAAPGVDGDLRRDVTRESA